MGADLIACWAFRRAEPGRGVKPLDVDAAIAIVNRGMRPSELDAWNEQANGGFEETSRDDLRQQIRDALEEMRQFEQGRGVVVIECPHGWQCWLAGGTSWGDDPNEDFTNLSNLSVLPRIMDALGFDVETPDA